MTEAAAALRPPSPAVDAIDVLHVPYTYFPDDVGGTEIYVRGLVEGLRAERVSSAVAAPGVEDAAYHLREEGVFRFVTAARPTLAQAYGAPDENAARSFRALVSRVRPRIVHLHARTAAVSELLVDIAHGAGAKVVFTYHTPTVSCVRGTMLEMGRSPCDGVLDQRRCTACVLEKHGVPPVLRGALAAMPEAIGSALGRAGMAGGIYTALRVGALIGAAHRRFHELMRRVDRVVAVCDWVADLLRANGVPAEKLIVCRQGHFGRTVPGFMEDGAGGGPLRLGYFGRLDPTKGPDLLISALRRDPDAAVELSVYGVIQQGAEAYADELRRAAARDPRIRILPALPPDEVDAAMRRCDLVAVPSRCLETGPLVVLEAFGAGRPVLGADLGGIAELVSDGVDGMLVASDNPAAWAAAIGALSADAGRVTALRAGIRPPRAMGDVAVEMARLYRAVLADGAG